MRKGKRIKRLRSRRYGVLDIETWGLVPKNFALGVFVWTDGYEEHIERFRSPDKMRDFIFSCKFRGYTIYGHNVEYDLLGITENPLTFFDKVIYNKSNFILGIKKFGKKDQIKVVDSFNLFRSKLEDIGKAMNFEKLGRSKDFDEGRRRPITEIDWDYCVRDCQIIMKAINQFRNWSYDTFGSNIGVTVASTAYKAWSCNWGRDFFVDDDINIAFRNSYYGGRCEVFKKGHFEEKLNYYDVNSLYPSVYMSIRFPVPEKMRKGRGLNQFRTVLKNLGYEGTAFIKTRNDLKIPILPMRIDGKLMFLNGIVEGWFNFNEIRFALSRGYELLDCYDFYYNVGMESPFKEYGNLLYAIRKKAKLEGNKLWDIFCKYLLNSLYGKFGEVREIKDWGHWDDPHDGMIFSEVRDGWGYWMPPDKQTREIFTDHTVLPWASYVTSGARIILYSWMEKAIDVWYCDTDSILSPSELPTDNELGNIKLEGTICMGNISKPKNYEIVLETNGKIKHVQRMKGIPSREIPENIFVDHVEFDRFFKSKEALRRDEIAGTLKHVSKINDWRNGDKRKFKEGTDFTISYSNSIPFTRDMNGNVY